MGKVKVSDLLYEAANLLCVAAEWISRGYVPPPPMEKSEWEKVKARVMERATADFECDVLPHKPTPFQWFDPDHAPDPVCVMVEIQMRVDTSGHSDSRWKCWDCNTSGPAVDQVTAGTGAVAHLVEMHPDERWPEIGSHAT